MSKDIRLGRVPATTVSANNDGGSLLVTVFVHTIVSEEVVDSYLAAVADLTKQYFVLEPAR